MAPYATSLVVDLKKSSMQNPVITIPGSIPIILIVFNLNYFQAFELIKKLEYT